MFLKRKKNLKQISLENQNIFLRIHAQKSQYELRKMKEDYRNSAKIANIMRKYTVGEGAMTHRPKTGRIRRPLEVVGI